MHQLFYYGEYIAHFTVYVYTLQWSLIKLVLGIELHIYIEEVKRKGLGRGVGPELPAVSFSYEFLFFL